MRYEFLVKMPEGTPCDFKPEGATWGSAEVQPDFWTVLFEASEDQAKFILDNCDYDGTNFRHRGTNEIFALDMLFAPGDFSGVTEGNTEMVEELTGTVPENVCAVLIPQHQATWNLADIRKYWTEIYFPFRNEEGVRDLLEALINGSYCHCRNAWLQIPQSVELQAKERMTEDDWAFLRDQWKVVSDG